MLVMALVEILEEQTMPFDTLNVIEDDVESYIATGNPPPTYLPIDKRDWMYHVGRIAYFTILYRKRLPVQPPVILETLDPPDHIYLHDGHHRLCGAILAGRKRIKINWKGNNPRLLALLQTGS